MRGSSFSLSEPRPPKFRPQLHRTITPDLSGITVPDDHMKKPYVITGPRFGPMPVHLNGNDQSGYGITFRIGRLIQTHSEDFGPFAAIFNSWDVINTFDAKVTGTAVNPAVTINEAIKFVIEVE